MVVLLVENAFVGDESPIWKGDKRAAGTEIISVLLEHWAIVKKRRKSVRFGA